MNSDYKWCMFFMSVVGLWPYTGKKLRLLQSCIVSLVICMFVIAQFLAFSTIERNLFSMLRLASFITLTMVACTRYHMTLYQINDVEEFLNRIKLHWRTNNEEILRIMRLHAFYGKRFVIIFAAFVYPSACMILVYHISPFILDKILPLNESRPTKFPVETDYLIDEEQHPILNNFLIYLSLITGVSIMVGTESLMIMVSAHIAGLYEIAR
ncbi:uncharacterized protein LOC143264890 isoform X2 [Megachile rotundata]|uniref:uncharacterized protein LOC143264890 isoform X2 n=1 Tax=Megachile rotundata TaxID=143995 RepID=UPI003FD2CD7B